MTKLSLKRGGLAALILLLGLGVLVQGRSLWLKRYDLRRAVERASLPEPVVYQPSSTTQPSPTSRLLSSPSPTPLPPATNLAVPFTPQAPHANWEAPYKEFCEEASVLMAIRYLTQQPGFTPDSADQELLKIKQFEDTRFGYYEDTTLEETATILREYYHYPQVRLLTNPSVLDIKTATAQGKAVIVPAAGRQLGNPYYQSPGPLYHMIVIKGYTANGKFIVNDPGTRRGADFLYDEAVIMHAMHDWRSDGQIELGRKAILIVG